MEKTSEDELKGLERHKDNSNLKLYRHPSYMGYPVMVDKGPFIAQYLESLYQVIRKHVSKYPRTTAIRFELKYPARYKGASSNQHITQFLKGIKYRINKRYMESTAKRAYETELGYVWVKEQDESEFSHYHCLFLLNKDAYSSLGSYQSRNGLHGRMREAWAAALGVSWEETKGLVSASEYEYVENSSPYHFVNMNSYMADKELKDLFLRASYLCKARTKHYGGGERSFGCSSIN